MCQRYGQEVNGGSEQYCRQIAEKLSNEYDVSIYTTCALDYITWSNYYSPGTEQLNNVTIKRFLVGKTRNRFVSALTGRVLRIFPCHSLTAEWHWIDLQGPYCPDLLTALALDANQYQVIFFMTYLYYTAARGLMLDLPNAVLIPTVHDEPPIYFHCYDQVFSKAKGLIWNTPEERGFADKRFPWIKTIPSIMAGIGIEAIETDYSLLPNILKGKQYLLYAGRIAKSKGCDEMLAYFRKYKKHHPNDLKFVMIGKPVMKIPKDDDIINLGFVSDQEKTAIMANATALVLHSRYESLSMVVLESMQLGCPVLVTAKCSVLKGHCERSNAGLYFNDYEDYENNIDLLLYDSKTYAKMQQSGRQYVAQNYRWERIINQYKQMIIKIKNIKERETQ